MVKEENCLASNRDNGGSNACSRNTENIINSLEIGRAHV
jgi:hypothetical protein